MKSQAEVILIFDSYELKRIYNEINTINFCHLSLCVYDSVSIISPQFRFAIICWVSISWKFVCLSSLPFIVECLTLPFFSFWMEVSFWWFGRGSGECRAGDIWPSIDRGFGLRRLLCILAVNSNIMVFSATELDEFELPSKRSTLSDDEYRDNGVGTSSWFAGTAKFSRIRIDPKFTSCPK